MRWQEALFIFYIVGALMFLWYSFTGFLNYDRNAPDSIKWYWYPVIFLVCVVSSLFWFVFAVLHLFDFAVKHEG